MNGSTRAGRERARLLTAAKRARGKRSRAAWRIARDAARLAEMAAALAELADLDAAEDVRRD